MVRTALVTGASRGIGKATALALAARGYDVAITARTLHDGDTSSGDEYGVPLPGSLDATAAEAAASEARVVPVRMDLLDLDSLAPTVDAAIDALGHLDVLVNNAAYVGSAVQPRFLDTEPAALIKKVTANVTAQLLVTQRAASHMVAARGGGLVLCITSNVAVRTPPQPADRGGWELIYAATKAGFHRIADMLAVEAGEHGIRAFNLAPGYVGTEWTFAARRPWAAEAVPPAVVGETIAWFADGGHEPYDNGGFLQLQDLARELGLLPAQA